MKVSLVVAQGVHTGKIIPITAPQFLIGRDPQCNLRPASPSISKQHCAIIVRSDKVFVKDFGSTNGTSVNGERIADERELANEDSLKVGPLDFVVKIEITAPRSTVKVPPARPAAVSTAASETAVASKTTPDTPAPTVTETASDDPDQVAAMLLAMDESGAMDPTTEAKIPDGTTVMDMPPVPGAPTPSELEKVKKEQADTSKAAADLLSKYMRRPRT